MNRIDREKLIDDMVETLTEWFDTSPEDNKKHFLKLSHEQLVVYHHTIGRSLRNKFKLWENPWKPDLINGIDHSKNHPDSLSMRAIERFHEQLTKE